MTNRFSTGSAQASNEGTPIPFAGRLSTSSSTYGTVISWTVASDVEGDLREIAMIANILASTEWRVTIGGTVRFIDIVFLGAASLPFATNRLVAGSVVLVEARSPDNATAVVADATITGVER